MRHGPAVCTVTVCWPSGIPPSTHSGSHYSPHTWHTKKASDTGCYYLELLKASSPDSQSTGNSKAGKGVIRLFFWDLLLPRHPGCNAAPSAELLQWNQWGWDLFQISEFSVESKGTWGYSFAQFSVLVWKKLQGTSSLTQTFADLLSCWKQLITSKDKNKVWKTERVSCAVHLRDVKSAVFLKGPGTFSLV